MRANVFGVEVHIDEAYLEDPVGVVERQLDQYLDGTRQTFDLRVRYPEDFTGAVMAAIDAIPYGEKRTYADLAADIDSAPIAVGQGCGRNPVPVIVPCHRVVRSDGGLGGYSSGGDRALSLKQTLLVFEDRVAHSSGGSPDSAVRRMSTW